MDGTSYRGRAAVSGRRRPTAKSSYEVLIPPSQIMTVKEKIAQKKALLAQKKDRPADKARGGSDMQTDTPKKLYTCTCKQCKIKYQTTNNLDLDGLGRCPPCRKIHDAELDAMMHKFPQSRKSVEPVYDEIPGIEYNGIKFIRLH